MIKINNMRKLFDDQTSLIFQTAPQATNLDQSVCFWDGNNKSSFWADQ